jgi:hypothetical protein
MGQLKQMADDSFRKMLSIDNKLEDWLLNTAELHAYCVGKQGGDGEKLRAIAMDLVAGQTKFDSQKNIVSDVKAASDKLSRQLDTASDAFKRASDGFPQG